MADDNGTAVITPSRVTGAQIAKLWEENDKLTRRERDIIEQARKLADGELSPAMPEELGEWAKDLGVSLPDERIIPLQTVNRVGKRRPRIKRPTKGVSTRKVNLATRIEQPTNALMEQLYPFLTTVDLVVCEGQCTVITQPEPTNWVRAPRRYEADDKTPRASYKLDREDRMEGDEGYSGYHEGRSSRAYQEDLREYQAEHPPFTIRAFSRRDCVPINPRFVGGRLEIDGVVVRQTFTRSDLVRRRFIWGDVRRLLSEDPAGPVVLYESWLLDWDGRPYCAYHVENATHTARVTARGEPQAAVVDLYKEYGICRLPVAFRYGLSFPGAAPGHRGVPLMAPFQSALLLMDSLASSKAVHASQHAFGGWFHIDDPSAPAEAWLDEGGDPKVIDVRQMAVQRLPPGDLRPAVHGGTNHDVQEMLALLHGSVKDREPGGETEGAGFAQLVSRAGEAESMHQIYDAVLELYEQSASFLLEQCCAWGEKFKPVVVALDVDRTAAESEAGELVDFDPGLAGGNYRLVAQFPPEENLPLRQQEAEFVEKDLMTLREFLERRGVEDPEQYMAEIVLENHLLDPERGQAELWEIAAEIARDERLKKQLDLLKANKIDAQGNPMSAITAGLVGPAPGLSPNPPEMTGMGGPSAAQASLAGVVGGGLSAGPLAQAGRAGIPAPMGQPGMGGFGG